MIDRIIATLKHKSLAKPNRFSILITPPKGIGNVKLKNPLSQLSPSDAIKIGKDGIDRLKIIRDTSNPLGKGLGIKELLDRDSLFDFTMGDNRLISYSCLGTSLPGRRFSTSERRIRGPLEKLPYEETFNEIQFTFLVNEDMNEKIFFDKWQDIIVDKHNNNYNYYDEYVTPILINQLDNNMFPTYSIELVNAWPIEVGEVALSHESVDAFHTLNVTFAYKRWINVEDKITAKGKKDLKVFNQLLNTAHKSGMINSINTKVAVGNTNQLTSYF